MPKVSEAHRSAQREKIVAAALRCFARTGYQRTSMADIVAESGTSAGTLYLYFSGKQELIRAVATRVLDSRRDELTALGADHALAPAEIIATVLEGIGQEGFEQVLVQLWAEATIDPEVGRVVHEVFGRLHATITEALTGWARAHPDEVEGRPDTWAKQLAPVLLSLGPGFILQRALIPEFDTAGYLDALVLAFPTGAGPGEGSDGITTA
jgi:AcrR family transcriptional regulator